MSEVEYRPSKGFGTFAVAIWVVTAVILFALGFILDSSDRQAMDGFQLLFFTVVPIKPFAWIMSVVFLGIGVSTARRVFAGPPTLRLSSDGFETRKGRRVPWSDIASVEGIEDKILRITLSRTGAAPETLDIGQFELGAAVRRVVEEVEGRRLESPPESENEA